MLIGVMQGNGMKLTNHTNYAIRMLMYCSSKDGLASVREIANFYDLPEKFLFKILNSLTGCGYVETIRGRSGGIRLAKPADQILLGDVIRDIEETFKLAECFDASEISCPLVGTCGLNQALSRALDSFFDVLNEYTIDDITHKRHNIHVLLELNQAKHIPFKPHISREDTESEKV